MSSRLASDSWCELPSALPPCGEEVDNELKAVIGEGMNID
jgi:hypothetical protein